MKTNISASLLRVICVSVSIAMISGCVHSYYRLQVASDRLGTYKDGANASLAILDSVWLRTEKTLIYTRDFSFFRRRCLGDWKYFICEYTCRFPTLLIEIPYSLLNSHFQQIPLTPDMLTDSFVHDRAPVKQKIALWTQKVVAVSNDMDCVRHGVMTLREVHNNAERFRSVYMAYQFEIDGAIREISIGVGPVVDWIYFTSQYECLALKEIGSWDEYNSSFCGIAIRDDFKWPVAFLWRIDLRTGKREPIAWLYNGKIIYDLP